MGATVAGLIIGIVAGVEFLVTMRGFRRVAEIKIGKYPDLGRGDSKRRLVYPFSVANPCNRDPKNDRSGSGSCG